jgi:ribonuclease HI
VWWQNRINPNIKGGLVWYTDRSKTSKGTSAGVYTWGSRSRHSFSLGLHTTIFQAEKYVTKACVTENTEKGYKGRNIYTLSDSQAAIKALYSFWINSELVLGCHQSLVKLAEHNRIPLVWVPGHMGIDGNKTADQLARRRLLTYTYKT